MPNKLISEWSRTPISNQFSAATGGAPENWTGGPLE